MISLLLTHCLVKHKTIIRLGWVEAWNGGENLTKVLVSSIKAWINGLTIIRNVIKSWISSLIVNLNSVYPIIFQLFFHWMIVFILASVVRFGWRTLILHHLFVVYERVVFRFSYWLPAYLLNTSFRRKLICEIHIQI